MASRAKPQPTLTERTTPPPPPPAPALTLAPTVEPDDPAPEPATLTDFRPVAVRARHDGWTRERQRTFLTVLAETGSISQACRDAGVSARSVYKLRQRPDAQSFAAAWDQALRLATLRLTTLAFERAVRGSTREIWRDGELVGQVRAPDNKVLIFLLANLLPRVGGGVSRLDEHDRAIDSVRAGFPAALDRLTDHDVAMVPLQSRDFYPEAPGDSGEDM